MLFTGDKILATNLPRIVAWGIRDTPKTGVDTTELEVFRFDNVPQIAGHFYQALISNINLDGSSANQIGIVKLRMATSTSTGTAATTASTQRNSMRQNIDDATNGEIVPWVSGWRAAADGYASLLWTVQKQGAVVGTIQWFCSSVDVAEFVVYDMGTTTGAVSGNVL